MHIGWAVADITPTRPVILRGQFVTRISQRVNDPLLASVLALEAQSSSGRAEQAILVSCDRVSVPTPVQQRIREVLRPRLQDVDLSKLVLCATHTHTAPEIEEGFYPPEGPEVMSPTEYADLFVERVAEAVEGAWNARAPGGVSWGYGHAVVGHNRRVTYAGGLSRMYGSTNAADFECIEGFEDHGVDLLFTWDARRRLSGVVINLACPSQVTEGESYVSADFWHEVRVDVAQRLGEGVHVLPQCSAAGDQSPHILIHGRAEEQMRRRRGLTEREEIARRIGNAVEEVLAFSRQEVSEEPTFRHVLQPVSLPVRMVTAAECAEARRQLAEWEQRPADPSDRAAFSTRFVMMRRYGDVIRRYETQEAVPSLRTDVHALRLGDVAFATNPFELFLDYGLRIKARSPAVQTFVVQLAGSSEVPASYLPTARAVASRSYGAEVTDALMGPVAGQMLVDRTVEMLEGLWQEP